MCEECSGWIRRRGRELRIVDSPPANRYRAVEPPAVYCALYNVKLNVTTTTIIKMKNNRELFATKATLKRIVENLAVSAKAKDITKIECT